MTTDLQFEIIEAEKQAKIWNASGQYLWGADWDRYAKTLRSEIERFKRAQRTVQKMKAEGKQVHEPRPIELPPRPQNMGYNQLSTRKWKTATPYCPPPKSQQFDQQGHYTKPTDDRQNRQPRSDNRQSRSDNRPFRSDNRSHFHNNHSAPETRAEQDKSWRSRQANQTQSQS